MIDYLNSKIYKIICKNDDIESCYVGATTNFNQRKNNHRMTCNNENAKNHNTKLYRFIRENGGWDNWKMVLIEDYSCEDKTELRKKEREVMESLEADLNTNKPYVSKAELNKTSLDYYHANKETIKLKRGDYFKEYNERTKKQRKEYYEEYNKRDDIKAYNRYLYFKKKREKEIMENSE